MASNLTMPRHSFLDTSDDVPYDYYRSVRAAGKVVWDDRMKSWNVVDYDIAKAVLQDVDGFAQIFGASGAASIYLKIRSDNHRSMMLVPPEVHRKFRLWWLKDLLSPKASRQYRLDIVDPYIDRLLDGFDGSDTLDLSSDYAERIPMGVFAALFDLPHRDDESLKRVKTLNDRLATFSSTANAGAFEGESVAPEARRIADAAVAASAELNAILLPLIEQRRDGTGEDLISLLWRGGFAIFDDWNDRDTLDATRRLMFAGVDTTGHAISNALYMLLTDDVLRRRIEEGDEKLVERFVEEVLRLNGSVQFRPRKALQDAELGGVRIRQGDMVNVILLAANRDPEHYACPDAVVLERGNPTDHIAFATGPRTCLGAHLARAELASAIRRLLAAFPRLRLDGSRPAPRFNGFLLRSWTPLHVRLD